MTSQSAIFNRIVNPIAPVDASFKKFLSKLYLKKLKFLLLTREKCILANQITAVNQPFLIAESKRQHNAVEAYCKSVLISFLHLMGEKNYLQFIRSTKNLTF